MLNGVRVVECAERIAGPFCGRLLVRLGAEVVKVERPGAGDPSRHEGPFSQAMSPVWRAADSSPI